MNFQLIVSWLQARLNADERGAAMVEYGLLVALIAVISILVLTTLGTDIRGKFQEIVNAI